MSEDSRVEPRRPAGFAFLTAHLPLLADRLARQITDEMLPLLEECGLGFEDVALSASLDFHRVDGCDDLRVSLSVGRPDAAPKGELLPKEAA